MEGLDRLVRGLWQRQQHGAPDLPAAAPVARVCLEPAAPGDPGLVRALSSGHNQQHSPSTASLLGAFGQSLRPIALDAGLILRFADSALL